MTGRQVPDFLFYSRPLQVRDVGVLWVSRTDLPVTLFLRKVFELSGVPSFTAASSHHLEQKLFKASCTLLAFFPNFYRHVRFSLFLAFPYFDHFNGHSAKIELGACAHADCKSGLYF